MQTKYVLAVLLSLATLPVLPGAEASQVEPAPICTYNIVAVSAILSPADACVDVDFNPLCIHAWARVYQRDVVTPGTGVQTEPIHLGPVHVSGVSVIIDPIWLASVPQRTVTNDFCSTQLLA